MRVVLYDDGLLVEPETEFEEQYIRGFYKKKFKVFVEHGLSVRDLIGLKITVEDVNEKNSN